MLTCVQHVSVYHHPRRVGSRLMDKNSQLLSFDISSNGEVNRVTHVVRFIVVQWQ
jgi:hypothetical protein